MKGRPGQLSGPTKPQEEPLQALKPLDQKIMMTENLFDRFWKRGDKTIDQVLSEAEQNLETKKRNLIEAIIGAIGEYTDAISNTVKLQNEAIRNLYQAGSELEKKVYGEIQKINGRLDVAERNIRKLGESYNSLVDVINDLGGKYNTLVEEIEGLREPIVAFKKFLEETMKYQPKSLEKINKQISKIELETYRQ